MFTLSFVLDNVLQQLSLCVSSPVYKALFAHVCVPELTPHLPLSGQRLSALSAGRRRMCLKCYWPTDFALSQIISYLNESYPLLFCHVLLYWVLFWDAFPKTIVTNQLQLSRLAMGNCIVTNKVANYGFRKRTSGLSVHYRTLKMLILVDWWMTI